MKDGAEKEEMERTKRNNPKLTPQKNQHRKQIKMRERENKGGRRKERKGKKRITKNKLRKKEERIK